MGVTDNIEKKLKEIVKNAILEAFGDIEMPDFLIEVPKDSANGDYSTNAAMLLARTLRKAPRAIADEAVKHIKTAKPIDKVEVAGAGFINFYLSNSYLYDVLEEVEKQGASYGCCNIGNGEKVCLEFVSANPTGPMHMGNARGGAIGDSLANIMKKAGFDVEKEFYVNDAGAQIDKFGRSLDARFLEIVDGHCDFPEDGYQGEDIRDHAKAYIEEFGTGLRAEEESVRRKKLIEYALPKNLEKMKKDLSDYRVFYDKWFFESELHESGYVTETIELLKKTNHVYEKDGAVWFKSTDFLTKKGDDDRTYKDDVLVRANGIPTYFAADIAYHRNKLEKRKFDTAINIWGADHHGHIARMKGALGALGIDPERLHVITMQLVRLMDKGEIVRMSKRTGRMITLSDLLQDIGIDAARFFFNLRQAGSHFDFDLSLAVEQSNDNPVFYVQYAHARICSIIRLLAEDGLCAAAYADTDTSLLDAPQETALLKRLAAFPGEIASAAESMEPSRITRYVMEVAADFHSFYNACRIRGEEENLAKARLKLCEATRTVIANCLEILGVTASEKM